MLTNIRDPQDVAKSTLTVMFLIAWEVIILKNIYLYIRNVQLKARKTGGDIMLGAIH